MLYLAGKPCVVCSGIEYTQQEKDAVICTRCRSQYNESGDLYHVNVEEFIKIKDKLEQLQNTIHNSDYAKSCEGCIDDGDQRLRESSCIVCSRNHSDNYST